MDDSAALTVLLWGSANATKEEGSHNANDARFHASLSHRDTHSTDDDEMDSPLARCREHHIPGAHLCSPLRAAVASACARAAPALQELDARLEHDAAYKEHDER